MATTTTRRCRNKCPGNAFRNSPYRSYQVLSSGPLASLSRIEYRRSHPDQKRIRGVSRGWVARAALVSHLCDSFRTVLESTRMNLVSATEAAMSRRPSSITDADGTRGGKGAVRERERGGRPPPL